MISKGRKATMRMPSLECEAWSAKPRVLPESGCQPTLSYVRSTHPAQHPPLRWLGPRNHVVMD